MPSLIVDGPESVPLHGLVSVLVLLSTEPVLGASATLPLTLPPGAVVDIVIRARQGLVIEGNAEGQLVISDQEETLPLQFKLRGVEQGLGQFRIFAFHNGQPLGSLPLRVMVLSTPEASEVRNHSEEHLLQPISIHHPDLSLLIFERKLSGKTELLFRLSAPDPNLGFNPEQDGPVHLEISTPKYCGKTVNPNR